MSEKLKDPFWQIHLSTAVVLMLVAGILLLVNISANINEHRVSEIWDRADRIMFAFSSGTSSNQAYGWPCVGYRIHTFTGGISFPPANDPNWTQPEHTYYWRWYGIIANLAVAASILMAFAFLCEYLIRRRVLHRSSTLPKLMNALHTK